jgi:hypothetical protein
MHRGIPIAFVVLVAAAPAPDRAADEAALRRIKAETWPGFYRTQDVEGLGRFLADSFINIGPDGTVETRAAALDRVRSNAWTAVNFVYAVERIDWHGDDLVTVTGRGTSERTTTDGRPCRHRYVSSNLLRRAPDRPHGWQALSSHVSGVSCTPMQAEAGAP